MTCYPGQKTPDYVGHKVGHHPLKCCPQSDAVRAGLEPFGALRGGLPRVVEAPRLAKRFVMGRSEGPGFAKRLLLDTDVA